MRSGRVVHRALYFATDAWDEFRHSPGVNLLAVLTLASALFLAGLVVLVIANLESQLERQRGNVQVHVYLQEGLEQPGRLELQREVAAMPGVARVEFVDKAEALRRYREWRRDTVELLDELGTNPLPESLELFLEPGPEAEARGEALVAGLSGREGVEEVRFDRDWLERLGALLDLARVGGSGLALFVFAAVVFVMASVLRLAVYARRDEIEIMLLVGATPAFVRGPFLFAGLAQGLVAVSLALAMVEVVRRAVLAHAASGSGLALIELLLARPLPAAYGGLLLVVGLAVSLTGAFFAVRRSL